MSTDHPPWIEQSSDGVILRIHTQPKASRSEVAGEYRAGESIRLKVRVAAQPVDGAANEALLHFLKKAIGCSASRIHLIRGSTSRSKDVLIQGVSVDEVVNKLEL